MNEPGHWLKGPKQIFKGILGISPNAQLCHRSEKAKFQASLGYDVYISRSRLLIQLKCKAQTAWNII